MSYTALVLDPESVRRLTTRFWNVIPEGWDVVAHHMTINMGPPEKGPLRGQALPYPGAITVVSLAVDDLALAVGVESELPSTNAQKHVTVAVNRHGGGKPVHSNRLSVWEPILDPFILSGMVTEVK